MPTTSPSEDIDHAGYNGSRDCGAKGLSDMEAGKAGRAKRATFWKIRIDGPVTSEQIGLVNAR